MIAVRLAIAARQSRPVRGWLGGCANSESPTRTSSPTTPGGTPSIADQLGPGSSRGYAMASAGMLPGRWPKPMSCPPSRIWPWLSRSSLDGGCRRIKGDAAGALSGAKLGLLFSATDPAALLQRFQKCQVNRATQSSSALASERPPTSLSDPDADDLVARWHHTGCWPSHQIADEITPTGYLANVHAKNV
jgi:hypothetical protein